MLVHLSVHNYAIVEHLDLELDRGMRIMANTAHTKGIALIRPILKSPAQVSVSAR